MDQIREQITRVLDEQGVLSRLKAELRASVFLALDDQDIRRGGSGLGSKSDDSHRKQLLAEDAGPLLLQLVQEFLQWSNLQFTQQVFEHEMDGLGPTPPLEALQQQLGTAISAQRMDQPLLLQLLQHYISNSSSATSATWQPAAGQQVGKPAAGSSWDSGTLPAQRQSGVLHARAAAAATHPQAAEQGPALVVSGSAGAGAAGVGGIKAPSKSSSFLGDASVAEESGLIGTQPEEAEEEYATILMPNRTTRSSDADPEDDASSTSSASPAEAPRRVSRPFRAAATGAAATAPTAAGTAAGTAATTAAQQAPLPPLGPGTGSRPTLPPMAAPAPAPVAAAGAAGWASSTGDMGSMAAACELSESFGHDRSFGDSSLELQGLDSPRGSSPAHGRAEGGSQGPAAARMGLEATGSTSSSSKGSSSGSRSSSPGVELEQRSADTAEQQPAAPSVPAAIKTAGEGSLPAVRAPGGKLAPLAPASLSTPAGLGQRTSEGLRDELLKSGLLVAPKQQQQQQPAAEGGSSGRRASAKATADAYARIFKQTEQLGLSQPHASSQTRRGGYTMMDLPDSFVDDGLMEQHDSDDSGGMMEHDEEEGTINAGRGSDSAAPAAVGAATAGWRRLVGSSPAAAAVVVGRGEASGNSGHAMPTVSEGGAQLSDRHSSQDGGGDDTEGSESDDDDFGLQGQQQLLAAARRQLSNRSNASSSGSGQQQRPAAAGVSAGRMQVEVSGASLELTCSDVEGEDEAVMPDDISLPLGDLLEDSSSQGSAAYEPPAQMSQAAGQAQQQQQAWSRSSGVQPAGAQVHGTAAGATASHVVGPAKFGGAQRGLGAAAEALELTDSQSDTDVANEPLAAAEGFVIDEDDF